MLKRIAIIMIVLSIVLVQPTVSSQAVYAAEAEVPNVNANQDSEEVLTNSVSVQQTTITNEINQTDETYNNTDQEVDHLITNKDTNDDIAQSLIAKDTVQMNILNQDNTTDSNDELSIVDNNIAKTVVEPTDRYTSEIPQQSSILEESNYTVPENPNELGEQLEPIELGIYLQAGDEFYSTYHIVGNVKNYQPNSELFINIQNIDTNEVIVNQKITNIDDTEWRIDLASDLATPMILDLFNPFYRVAVTYKDNLTTIHEEVEPIAFWHPHIDEFSKLIYFASKNPQLCDIQSLINDKATVFVPINSKLTKNMLMYFDGSVAAVKQKCYLVKHYFSKEDVDLEQTIDKPAKIESLVANKPLSISFPNINDSLILATKNAWKNLSTVVIDRMFNINDDLITLDTKIVNSKSPQLNGRLNTVADEVIVELNGKNYRAQIIDNMWYLSAGIVEIDENQTNNLILYVWKSVDNTANSENPELIAMASYNNVISYQPPVITITKNVSVENITMQSSSNYVAPMSLNRNNCLTDCQISSSEILPNNTADSLSTDTQEGTSQSNTPASNSIDQEVASTDEESIPWYWWVTGVGVLGLIYYVLGRKDPIKTDQTK